MPIICSSATTRTQRPGSMPQRGQQRQARRSDARSRRHHSCSRSFATASAKAARARSSGGSASSSGLSCSLFGDSPLLDSMMMKGRSAKKSSIGAIAASQAFNLAFASVEPKAATCARITAWEPSAGGSGSSPVVLSFKDPVVFLVAVRLQVRCLCGDPLRLTFHHFHQPQHLQIGVCLPLAHLGCPRGSGRSMDAVEADTCGREANGRGSDHGDDGNEVHVAEDGRAVTCPRPRCSPARR
jgi:hypothetical protein